MIYIGKQLPKELKRLGFVEKSAMHIGRGLWFIRAELEANNVRKACELKPKTKGAPCTTKATLKHL